MSQEGPSRLMVKASEEMRRSQQNLLTQQEELRASGKLFEDPEFPTDDSVMPDDVYEALPEGANIVWKRPPEFCNSAKFVSGGTSRFDVRQGAIGDCWLLAAVASLSMHQELFDQVVPTDQEFADKDYCGMFKFRFWQFGEWKDVWIDDRLPTCDDRLIFMRSTDSDEFWSALLEKAYAKTMGSYRALVGGSSSEAMEDFTAGITEFFDLVNGPPAGLFETMSRANKRRSLMGCGINADPSQIEARLDNGLIMGHAYSITAVEQVHLLSGQLESLVRIRNPWGNEEEWKGSWSDDSSDWDQLSEEEKTRIGLSNEDDGEFWMSFDDFAQNFQKVEICHLGPDSLNQEQDGTAGKTRWEAITHHGSWTRNVNAGGCRVHKDTFSLNPQFIVKVVDPDEDDDEDMGSLIIGLMQKNMRKQGSANHFIGYIVYPVKESDPPGPKDMKFFMYRTSAAKSPSFGDTREITGRHKLAPGTYVVVPSTYDPNMEAEFLLRIYSEQPSESVEVDDIVTVPDTEEIGESSNIAAEDPKLAEREKELEAAASKAFAFLLGDGPGFVVDDLQDILNTAFTRTGPKGFKGFSKEACRSLLAFVDADRSGYLQFDEFKTLWKCLRLWCAVFKAFDADQSGDFNSFELRAALGCIGYRVPNKIYQSVVMRYADRTGAVKFDDFVILCVRLKTILENFKAKANEATAQVAFSLDEFLQVAIYT